MDRFNIREACEVFRVEGEDAVDVMDMHGSHQPSVMHLDSRDAIEHKEPAPFLVDRGAVGEKSKTGFY